MDVRGIPAPAEFDERVDTRFHLDLFSEEWGFLFCHRGKSSRIRITDIAFVHGRDDYHLLDAVPPLKKIGSLLHLLERQYALSFRRDLALIRSELSDVEPVIRAWLAKL